MATDPVPSRRVRAHRLDATPEAVAAILAELEDEQLPEPDDPFDGWDPFDVTDDTPWVPLHAFLAYNPRLSTDPKGRIKLSFTVDRKYDLQALAVSRHQITSLRFFVERPLFGDEREQFQRDLAERQLPQPQEA